MTNQRMRAFARNLSLAIFSLPIALFAQVNTSHTDGAITDVCNDGINYYDAGGSASPYAPAAVDPETTTHIFRAVGPGSTLRVDFTAIDAANDEDLSTDPGNNDTLFIFSGTPYNVSGATFLGALEGTNYLDNTLGTGASGIYNSGIGSSELHFVFVNRGTTAGGGPGWSGQITQNNSQDQNVEAELVFGGGGPIPPFDNDFNAYVLCPGVQYEFVANLFNIGANGTYAAPIEIDSVVFNFIENGSIITDNSPDNSDIANGNAEGRAMFTYNQGNLYELRYTVYDKNCSSYEFTEDLYVLRRPQFNFTSSVTNDNGVFRVCEGDQFDITGNAGAQASPPSSSPPFIQSRGWNAVPAPSTASNSVLTHSGTLAPGTYPYTYRAIYEENNTCPFDTTISVVVTARPDAGTPRDFNKPNGGSAGIDPDIVCETVTSYNLNNTLDGEDAGGVWTSLDNPAVPIGGANGNIVNPNAIGADPNLGPGIYNFRYMVPGGNTGCPDVSQTVQLRIEAEPFAGTTMIESARLDVCTDENNLDMFALLDDGSGTPDLGGTWTAKSGTNCPPTTPNAQAVNEITGNRFLSVLGLEDLMGANTELCFDFTYTVESQFGECSQDQATVKLRVVKRPMAGLDTTINVCSSDGILQLDNYIKNANYNPDQGTWTDVKTPTPAFTGLDQFDPSLETNNGVYLLNWTLDNSNIEPPCDSSGMTLTINFQVEPDAGDGSSNTIQSCDTEEAYDLFDALDRIGNTTDGLWYGPDDNNMLTNGGTGDNIVNFTNAATYPPGNTFTFYYRIPGNKANFGDPTGCDTSEAVVTIKVNDGRSAGKDSLNFFVCETDAPFRLIDVLNGTPEAGGQWRRISPNPVAGLPDNFQFDPSSVTCNANVQYVFEYSHPGITGCPNNPARLSFTVSCEPNAGGDATDIKCNVDGIYSLGDNLVNGDNGYGNPGSGISWRYVSVDGVTINNDVDGNGEVNLINLEGDYTFLYIVSSAGCSEDTASFTLTVNPMGNAGKDSMFVVCSTDPMFGLFPFIDDGNVTTGGTGFQRATWTDFNNTGGVVAPTNFATQFNPIDVTQTSPVTGDPLYFVVEVENCPNDTAVVTAFISVKNNSGLTGDTIEVCENEISRDLFEGIDGDYDQSGVGRWELDIWPAFRGSNATFVALANEVNNTDRATYFSGDPDDSNFNFDAFADIYKNTVAAGDADMLFDNCTFRFSYTVTDTTINKFQGVTDNSYACADTTTYAFFNISRDYADPAYDFKFDPAVGNSVLFPPVDGTGKVIVCETETGFDLKEYFPGLMDIADALGCRDQFQINGHNPASTLYDDGPNDRFLLRIADFDPEAVSNFPITISVRNQCDNFTSSTPLNIQTEIEPVAGPDIDLTLCTTGDQVNLASGDIIGPLAQDYNNDPSVFQFQGCDGPSETPRSGTFWDPKKANFSGPAGTFCVEVTWLGVSCPDSKMNINITVNEAPNPGADKFLTVCEDESIQLSNVYVNDPDVSKNGVFNSDANCFDMVRVPFSTAQANTDGKGGEVCEIYYLVEDDDSGCAPDSSTLTVEVLERPFPGKTKDTTLCRTAGVVNLLSLMKHPDYGDPTPGGIMSPGGSIFFDVTANGPGVYTFTYTVGDGDICPFENATLTLTVNDIARAGSNGADFVCVGAPLTNLYDILNGQIDGGGWFFPDNNPIQDYMSGPNNRFFDQTQYKIDGGMEDTLVFRYVVKNAPCPNDTSVATIYILPEAKSGPQEQNGVTICQSETDFDLFTVLGTPIEPPSNQGDYLPGGVWTNITPNNGGLNGSRINPSTLGAGTVHIFRYTVNTLCGTSSSFVNVTIDPTPRAGSDDSVAICNDGVPIDLRQFFPQFNVSDGFGAFVDCNGRGGLTGNIFNYPVAGPSPYDLCYVRNSQLGVCVADTANIRINVFEEPNPGDKPVVAKIVCSDSEVIDLYDLLTGEDPNGEFEDVTANGNARIGNNFDPKDVPCGGVYEFDYVVDGGPCGKASARIKVKVDCPDAGMVCSDFDGDGVRNLDDLDDDNDGINDLEESGGFDLLQDDDGDLILNFEDEDFAAAIGSQKVSGVVEAFDPDNDGLINMFDLDSDGDCIPDMVEAHPVSYQNYTADPAKNETTNNINNDGINPVADNDVNPDTDGDGDMDYVDLDSDGDGILDNTEAESCINPVNSDSDQLADYRDTDSDNDGIDDAIENEKGRPDLLADRDGDGIANIRDRDSDGDGIPDNLEARFDQGVNGKPEDFDKDGLYNFIDKDSDNDLIWDRTEAVDTLAPVNTDADLVASNPVYTLAVMMDLGIAIQADEQPDWLDLDSDGDGISDRIESLNKVFDDIPHDATPGDSIPDYRSFDSDADLIPDAIEAIDVENPMDSDNDGVYDFQTEDADGDGLPDIIEVLDEPEATTGFILFPFDSDGDGMADFQDLDSDDDRILDAIEGFYTLETPPQTPVSCQVPPVDTDCDGIPDYLDEDSDDDTLSDDTEAGPDGSNPLDSDGDLVFNFRDLDSDGDGIVDRVEGSEDCDNDRIPNSEDPDDNCLITTFVPEGFTPNGDGQNDFFVIPEAELYPNNKLTVYNRWGGVIFEASGYDNTWNGTNEDGQELQDGTYFYTLDLGLGQEALTGFVYISRN